MPRIKVPSVFGRNSQSWTIHSSLPTKKDDAVSSSKDNKNNLRKRTECEDEGGDATNWDKFRLLLWKNYKIQIRHKFQTIVEVTLPILFTLVLVIVRRAIESKVIDVPTIYPTFPVNVVPETPRLCCNEIYYAPQNEITDRLIKLIQKDYFNKSHLLYSFTGFETERELEQHYANSSANSAINSSTTDDSDNGSSSPVLAGIVFTNSFPEDGKTFPKSIQYKIRFPATPRGGFDFFEDRFGIKKIWFTEILYPVVQLFGPRAAEKVTGGVPGYYEEGFLYIQNSVERTLTKMLLENDRSLDDYEIKLQRFPYPGYIDDKFLFTLQGILPLTLILSFIFPVINITKSVIVEKEKRLKEYMKMMGLPNFLHWAAWFIKSFVFLGISSALITLLLKIRLSEDQILPILPNGDPTLIYVTILTHVFQLICFSFFISTLFKTANSGAIVGAILWFVFFIPFAFLQPRYNGIPRGHKILWSFATNIGICFSCQLFCMFEGTGVGAQWSSLFSGVTPDDSFCIADCMAIMIFNGLFYLFLTAYVEAVWPGEFGIPQPWYFLFTKWYWTGELRMSENDSNSNENSISEEDSEKRKEFFENVSNVTTPGIQIKGLTKKYGDSKVAVNNLHLDLFENEVFALLGHNAAGKTTTMSLLAGIFPPTSGTAYVNGYDICKDMKAVRRSFGFCPQSNVLFSELTVGEHLRFFSTLKGLKNSQVDSEVKRMIKAIGLENKIDTRASALSGGMKRRLSLAIAFCADSKIVLLDEVSSGLDPAARRAIWDLIQGEKKGRTILLSTHYMDEADILGDRIAIMAEGQVQCCGSSLFLKKKYGCGYHLVIVKEPKCNVEEITKILKSKLEDVEEEQNVGAELSYALPDNQSHLFADVFQELETKKKELGIDSYAASLTTIEEVFMRVGQLLDQNDSLMTQKNGMKPNGNGNSSLKTMIDDVALNVTFLNGSRMSAVSNSKEERKKRRKNTGISLRLQQFRAMLIKKFIFFARKPGLLAGQVAIPTIYLTLILLVLTTIPGIYDPPSHPIVLDDYESFAKAITLVKCPEESQTCKGYKDFLESKQKIAEDVPDNFTFIENVLRIAEERGLPYLNFKYFVGYDERPSNFSKSPNATANANKTDLIGFFNNQPLHTPPLALNFITNAILRSYNSLLIDNETSENANGSAYEIEVANHPFEYDSSNVSELGSYFTIGFQVGLHLSLAMGFTTGIYSIFPIKERALGSKHLQFVSGANFVIFWIANLLVDLVAYALPCLAIHAILIGYQVADFYSVTVQFYLLLIFYCYAFAVLPMMYLASLFFQIPSSGLVGMGIFNVLTGYATIFVVSILENPELEKGPLATTLHRIFLVVPTYALGKGITQISVNHQLGKACGSFQLEFLCEAFPDNYCCSKLQSDYLDWQEFGIGKNLVYLGVVGTVCWILLLIAESGLLNNIMGRFQRKIENSKSFKTNTMHSEDEDVHNERERIRNTQLDVLSKTDNLIIRDLTKMYSNGTLAVDRISLGVKKGECFGLLGANGAGKTSTFKMLTGELPVSSGDAYIYKNCVRTAVQQAHRNMGYCPQNDSLIEEMTGRETLCMYARLRGIPEGQISKIICKLADDLLFSQFLDKVVKSYSGGNKRKLSTAVALVGNPPIVFLDEPTCGIDPMARRHLWECITRLRDAGTSIVLTSHSMEETEFLCTRISIMVNGRLRCLGSPQQLKSKFGEGYTLTAQTEVNGLDELEELSYRRVRHRTNSGQGPSKSKLSALRNFIEESLPGCTLEDIHQGFLHYRVQSDKVTWAQMFTVMEAAKEKFKVEAYSVGQTSLEQVFLNFTKAQLNTEDNIT